jgi:ankyrin repeat protein
LGKEIPALSDHLDYLLWVVTKEGHEALVQVLLKRGANPTTVLPLESNYPYPCLSQQSSAVAVAEGHLSVVEAIISSMGTSETLRDSFFLENLLLLAATKGQSTIVRYLLEKGPSPCLRDSSGNHIMWHAAGYCSEDAIACSLEYGANPNPSPPLRGSSALKFALQGGKIPGAPVLISKMFEGDSIPESHREPEFLCAAAACGSTDVVETLLRSGADPNAAVEDDRAMSTFKSEPNCTALRLAIGYNHESTIRLLLDGGAKPTPQALIDALRNRSVSIVELLLESGFDQNEFLENIRRHLYVARMNESLVRLLFERSPDPKIKARRHTLTMVEALQAGQPDRVQLILDRGQPLELPEDYPSPSDLLDAATLGGLPTLELLFRNGYKVVRQQGGSHAVLTAISRHNPEALELLLQRNIGLPPSRPLASTVDGMFRNLYPNPPFFSHGTRQSAQAILDLLLSHGFNIDSRPGKSLGKDGQTYLWAAVERRDPVVTRILLDRGAIPCCRVRMMRCPCLPPCDWALPKG